MSSTSTYITSGERLFHLFLLTLSPTILLIRPPAFRCRLLRTPLLPFSFSDFFQSSKAPTPAPLHPIITEDEAGADEMEEEVGIWGEADEAARGGERGEGDVVPWFSMPDADSMFYISFPLSCCLFVFSSLASFCLCLLV